MAEPTTTTDLGTEEWLAHFEKHAKRRRRFRHVMRTLPSDPRCKMCSAPFGGPGRALRLFGYRPSRKNPKLCDICVEASPPGGFETEGGVLFADVRGYTSLAEALPPSEVATLMNRFYEVATHALIDHDAIVDKLVGDEVMGLFWPEMMGEEPLAEMVAAGDELLRGVSPWLPVGVGIHFGNAFVGNVGSGGIMDFTAIGDAVNTAARLQAAAGPGQMVLSDRVYEAVRDRYPDAEPMDLELKGKRESFGAWVVRVTAVEPVAAQI